MNKPTFFEERKLWEKARDFVIGVDEVGRGSFAGPVVAGGVVFRKDSNFKRGLLFEINDSKLLNCKKREMLAREIKKDAFLYAVTTVGVSTIDKVGIGKATSIAARKTIKKILGKIYKIDKNSRAFVLTDGFCIRYIKGVGLVNQKAIIKGDQKSVSIAAASIIAKVKRDNLMTNLDKKYPNYGFAGNKGYGTKFHRDMLKKKGLTSVHRASFNLGKFLSL